MLHIGAAPVEFDRLSQSLAISTCNLADESLSGDRKPATNPREKLGSLARKRTNSIDRRNYFYYITANFLREPKIPPFFD